MLRGLLIWIGRIARFVGDLVLVVFGLAALGSLLPGIPVLGSIAPVFVAPYAPWIVILSLVGVAAKILRWRRIGRLGTLVMAGIAGFAVVGLTVIQARQIALARDNGVQVDLARTLWLGSEDHKGPPPRFLSYGADQGRPLGVAIYRPAAGAGHSPAPVLVYVHGGGWGGGSAKVRQSDMRWLADRGYLVISIDYALSTKTRHTWDTTPPQVGCALAWIAGNAPRFGGDPSRLALIGESAGGNIILTASYMAAEGTLRPSCAGSVPRIAAVIATYPIVDATRMYRNRDVLAGPFGRIMTINYTGGTPEQYPDRYALVSPPTHVTPAAPPTLLIVGGSDHRLPPPAAHEFVTRARDAGVSARIIEVPYAEHSFDLPTGSIGSQLVRQATLRFLRENGVTP